MGSVKMASVDPGSSSMEGTRGKYDGGGGSMVGSVRLSGGLCMGSALGSIANFFKIDFERCARSTTSVDRFNNVLLGGCLPL